MAGSRRPEESTGDEIVKGHGHVGDRTDLCRRDAIDGDQHPLPGSGPPDDLAHLIAKLTNSDPAHPPIVARVYTRGREEAGYVSLEAVAPEALAAAFSLLSVFFSAGSLVLALVSFLGRESVL